MTTPSPKALRYPTKGGFLFKILTQLTKIATNILRIGTIAHAYDTCRHDKNDPSKKIMNMPDAAAIPEKAFKMPRIDVSLNNIDKFIINNNYKCLV